MNSNPPLVPAAIPTGSLKLDRALAIGGIPRGQITEISGEDNCGKTTLCLHIMAEAQRLGGVCAYIDADHNFDPRYASQCGVTLTELYLVEPTSAEQALDTAFILARSGAYLAIIIDSLAHIATQADLLTPYGFPSENPAPDILSKWLPLLLTTTQQHPLALIMTDQFKMGMSSVYHDLEMHLSRLALPLAAGLRLRLSTRADPQKTQPVHRVQVQIIKNKFAPCSKPVMLDIIVNRGINITGELFDLGLELAVISRQATHYSYRSMLLGDSRNEVLNVLRLHPGLGAEIEQVIRQKMRA